jgi:hypothetical protein
MAKLVIEIPAQRYVYELNEDYAEAIREGLADDVDIYDLADRYISDVYVDMEVEFVE